MHGAPYARANTAFSGIECLLGLGTAFRGVIETSNSGALRGAGSMPLGEG